MRFVRGGSLKEAIERFHRDDTLPRDPGRRSLELRKLLRRFLDICNAIDYAHSRGVLSGSVEGNRRGATESHQASRCAGGRVAGSPRPPGRSCPQSRQLWQLLARNWQASRRGSKVASGRQPGRASRGRLPKNQRISSLFFSPQLVQPCGLAPNQQTRFGGRAGLRSGRGDHGVSSGEHRRRTPLEIDSGWGARLPGPIPAGATRFRRGRLAPGACARHLPSGQEVGPRKPRPVKLLVIHLVGTFHYNQGRLDESTSKELPA
jgi:hypothetical protein